MVKKILTERLLQLARRPRLCLGFGQVNDDPYGAAGRQFASPPDDELFRLSVQIAFPERKRIQCMKKLRDVVDAQLNQIAGRGFGHYVVGWLSDIANRPSQRKEPYDSVQRWRFVALTQGMATNNGLGDLDPGSLSDVKECSKHEDADGRDDRNAAWVEAAGLSPIAVLSSRATSEFEIHALKDVNLRKQLCCSDHPARASSTPLDVLGEIDVPTLGEGSDNFALSGIFRRSRHPLSSDDLEQPSLVPRSNPPDEGKPVLWGLNPA